MIPSTNITTIVRNGKEIVFWLKSGHEVTADNIVDVEVHAKIDFIPDALNKLLDFKLLRDLADKDCAMTEWISVKDRLPDGRKHKKVLTFEIIRHIDTNKKIPIVCLEETKSLHKDRHGVYTDGGGGNITHWMPLPAAPDSSKKTESSETHHQADL